MRTRAVALLALALLLSGCDLDLANPNARLEQDVLTSEDGIVALTIGMQGQFASSIEDFIQAPALVTDEWGTGTRSLIAYRTLLTGVGVDDDFGVVEQPWAAAYSVVRSANNVIGNARQVGLPPGVAMGLVATAKLYKAMALGLIAQQYDRILVNVEGPGVQLVSRSVAYDTVQALLESARADVAGLSEADLLTLRGRVLGTGFDLVNTIDAMLARFYLFDEEYQRALEAAQRVDLNVRSVFPFTAPNKNPIFDLSVDAAYVAPLWSFTVEAEEGDNRVPYWVDVTAVPVPGNPDSLLLPLNQYNTRSAPFPAYIPDEMTLIAAEAHARLGNLARARELINAVRTRPTIEPLALLPALPPEALDTLDEVLNQIAYERRYELYLQGVRWEDMRRLDEFIEEEPAIPFLPIPRQECLTNPILQC